MFCTTHLIAFAVVGLLFFITLANIHLHRNSASISPEIQKRIQHVAKSSQSGAAQRTVTKKFSPINPPLV